MQVELAAVDVETIKVSEPFLLEGEICIKCKPQANAKLDPNEIWACRLRTGEVFALVGMVIPIQARVVVNS